MNCLDPIESQDLISAPISCQSAQNYPGAVFFRLQSVVVRSPQNDTSSMKNPTGAKSILSTQMATMLLSCLLALAAMQPAVEAATITVTDTGDTIAVDGLVTLREAITSANNNADVNADVVAVGAYGTDTINFNIAGTGVHTIAPFPALPTITDPVIIDGYTQPGSAANTQTTNGDDAVLLIELNGPARRCEWLHDYGRQ